MKETIYNYLFFFAANSDDNFVYGNEHLAQFSYIVLLTIFITSLICGCIFYLFLNRGHRVNDSRKVWWLWAAINALVSSIAVIFILQMESYNLNLLAIPFADFDFVVIPLYLFHTAKWSFVIYFMLSFIIRLGSENASHVPDFKTK